MSKANRKNIAVLLAGGKGSRFGNATPKQFLCLNGKTIIEHTACAFQQNPKIDEIVIVTSMEHEQYIMELMERSSIGKFTKILPNGAERYHSTLSAINCYRDKKNINLLIHDAVRPLVSQKIINNCIDNLKEYTSVSVAIPCTDTIYELNNDKLIQNIPNRQFLYKAQTPQCFHLETLQKAYDKALQDPNFQTTDDIKVIQFYCPEVQTAIVQGDTNNMKLTYAEDMLILEQLMSNTRT